MTAAIVTLELGGQTLHCHVDAHLGEPAQTSGPPEHCHPGSPDELDLQSVWLEVSVSEDLSPDPKALRNVEVDITEMLAKLDTSLAELEERCANAFDWDSLAEDSRGDERDWDEE